MSIVSRFDPSFSYPTDKDTIANFATKWAELTYDIIAPDDDVDDIDIIMRDIKAKEWDIEDWNHFLNVYWCHQRDMLFEERLAERIARDTQKSYQYLVTFTIDPKKHPQITETLKEKIIRLIESTSERKALQVIECSYVEELHKSGRPHWHMKLILSKALRSDAFTQFTKVYGKVDISRSKHTNGQHIDIYMEKEGSIKVLKSITA